MGRLVRGLKTIVTGKDVGSVTTLPRDLESWKKVGVTDASSNCLIGNPESDCDAYSLFSVTDQVSQAGSGWLGGFLYTFKVRLKVVGGVKPTLGVIDIAL